MRRKTKRVDLFLLLLHVLICQILLHSLSLANLIFQSINIYSLFCVLNKYSTIKNRKLSYFYWISYTYIYILFSIQIKYKRKFYFIKLLFF